MKRLGLVAAVAPRSSPASRVLGRSLRVKSLGALRLLAQSPHAFLHRGSRCYLALLRFPPAVFGTLVEPSPPFTAGRTALRASRLIREPLLAAVLTAELDQAPAAMFSPPGRAAVSRAEGARPTSLYGRNRPFALATSFYFRSRGHVCFADFWTGVSRLAALRARGCPPPLVFWNSATYVRLGLAARFFPSTRVQNLPCNGD
jgi:hypothetical protein